MCFQITVSLERAGVNTKFFETPEKVAQFVLSVVMFENLSCQGVWEDTSSNDNIDLASLEYSDGTSCTHFFLNKASSKTV